MPFAGHFIAFPAETYLQQMFNGDSSLLSCGAFARSGKLRLIFPPVICLDVLSRGCLPPDVSHGESK
jgi:hypothetical protein